MVDPAVWKDYQGQSEGYFIYTNLKNVNQTWPLKQQSSNFIEMTSVHYVNIQSFRNIFTVSQTALVKLIVILNCKDF